MTFHFIDLPRISHVEGIVRLPGSKSISNRALLLAALAEGTTALHGVLSCEDTDMMKSALRALGVSIEKQVTHGQAPIWVVQGANIACSGQFPVTKADLFMGNAGTVMRPLTAVLGLLGGEYTLHGTSCMHERPIEDLVNALSTWYARIDYEGKRGYPPLRISQRTPPNTYALPSVTCQSHLSSQFLTALLIAAPLIAKRSVAAIDISHRCILKPYIGITLHLMKHFGVMVTMNVADRIRFTVPEGQCYQSPKQFHVEGDASSASYFLAAGAISAKNDAFVRVEGVGRKSVQGDVRFVEVLTKMGARITMGDHWIAAQAPANGMLQGVDMDLHHMPDAAMTVAMLACHAQGTTILRNIASWRIKETDRLTAMGTELRKLGAIVTIGDDFLRIIPPDQLRSTTIETYGDHRMAMCFSLASLDSAARRGVLLRILNPACVKKTFPDYFKEFSQITAFVS